MGAFFDSSWEAQREVTVEEVFSSFMNLNRTFTYLTAKAKALALEFRCPYAEVLLRESININGVLEAMVNQVHLKDIVDKQYGLKQCINNQELIVLETAGRKKTPARRRQVRAKERER